MIPVRKRKKGSPEPTRSWQKWTPTPVLNPVYAGDVIAVQRVEESKILLNLDHPDFNTKREQLYHEIFDDVTEYEEPGTGTMSKNNIRARMEKRLSPKAPFSTAARYYLRLHRHLNWVEDLIKTP